jgi:hypothetical protein
LQLERRTPLPPARSTVLVYEDEAGTLTIQYRGARMAYTEITWPRPASPAASSGTPASVGVAAGGAAKPSVDHPWRRTVEEGRITRNLGLARRAWRSTHAPSTDEPRDEGTFLSS